MGLAANPDAVRATVADCCDRLFDPDLVSAANVALSGATRFPELAVWRPASLAYGDAGLAVLTTAVYGILPPELLRRTGYRLLASGARELGGDLSLFEGLAGYASAVTLLRGERDGDYQQIQDGLDRLMLPAMVATATAAGTVTATSTAGTGTGSLRHDVVSGLAGWWAYLSLRPPTGLVGKARDGVVAVLAGLVADDPCRTMRVDPDDYLDATLRSTAPAGYVDCGLAHGVAGIVAVLAIEVATRASTPAWVRAALDNGASWLAARLVETPDGMAAPRVAVLDADRRAVSPGTLDRPGWCYGTPGVARALWLAGQSLDNAGYRRLGYQAIGSCVSESQIARLESPTLCHGLAGLALIVSHFAWDTGAPALVSAAGDLIDQLVGRFEPASVMGYRDREIRGETVDSAGFLTGAAGVAATLAAVLSGEAPRWSRLLLLS